ncbi:cytochrome P450 [Ceratobasidium sp. AG-I]|nr:cytochrome P450 [Ceratobasidium sp. AG-I]
MSSTSDLYFVYFLAALATFIVVRKLYASIWSPISEVPGPQGAHWFWGHEMITFEKSYGETYTSWVESFGTTYKIKGALFYPDILVTADPGALGQILGKETYSYVKSPVIRPLAGRLLGESVVWAEGATHKRMRHQLAPFFTTQATHDTFEVIHACAHTGAERLAAYVSTTSDATRGARLDIMDWTWRVALDIIGRVAFGYDFGCGESENAREIHQSWVDQVNAGFHRMGVVGLFVLRAFPFIVKLPLKAIEAQEGVKLRIQSIGRSMLEHNVHDSKNNNLLSYIARLAATEDSGISNQELLDHISTITVAGNETLAGSLGFAFWELARNPGVCARLREEIAQLGREPQYNDYMDNLPWLDALTKEVFRLHPVASHLERTALKDDILKLQNPLKTEKGDEVTHLRIKAGQLIHIPTHSMGRIKSVWGEDANEFKPERWLDPSRLRSASDIPPGWNGLLAFSGGLRICLGVRLAVLEFKVTLATYVRRFEFCETGVTIHTKFVATLQPYVVGEEDKGQQLPLIVSLLDTEC